MSYADIYLWEIAEANESGILDEAWLTKGTAKTDSY